MSTSSPTTEALKHYLWFTPILTLQLPYKGIVPVSFVIGPPWGSRSVIGPTEVPSVQAGRGDYDGGMSPHQHYWTGTKI